MITRIRRSADDLLDRLGRTRLALALVALLVVAVGGTAVYKLTQEGEYRITARFAATPGLYEDNDVDILGVPTGHIVSLTPHSGWVDVVIALPDHVKVPADASAVLMAPNPVSDRFVELTPAWVPGKAVMAHGAVLERSHTFVPLELDQVFSSLDSLATSLGPDGANSQGDLTAALHAFAQLASGNGKDLHAAIESIAAALPALTAHPGDLKNLITSLDSLTGKLAARNTTINDLYDNLATATGDLAGDKDSISAAIANLQRALTQVSAFITANQANIKGGVKNLNTVVTSVLAEQKALIQTFDTAPLGFSNFNRAIDPNGPCASATGSPDACARLWARVDMTMDAATFIKAYCGDSVIYSLLPILLASGGLAKATATDTTCTAQFGMLQGRTGPPGSPNTPDLGLSQYLGR